MKALGILLAAGGALLLAGGGAGGLLLHLARSALLDLATLAGDGATAAGPLRDLAFVAGTKGTLTLVLAAVSVPALAAGVGLARGRPRGRTWGLIWAPLALASLVAEVLVELLAVGPATDRAAGALAADLAAGGDALAGSPVPASWLGSLAGLGTAAAIFNALLLAVVPVLTLALLLRAKAGNGQRRPVDSRISA